MAQDPRLNLIPGPPRRVFGVDDSTEETAPAEHSGQTRPNSRISFGQLPVPRKISFIHRFRANPDEEAGGASTSQPERPPIPSALTQATETYATPLPVLSMIVLSIVNRVFVGL
jgi:hypothetical protein